MIRYSANNVLNKVLQLVKSKFDSLAKVATTGSYNDLTDKPQIGTTSRASVSITIDGTSTIAIPITVTDVTQMTVYQNGLILTPDVHYTATTSEITLVNYVANLGDIFTFVGTTEAGIALNGSASQVLFSDTTEDNCYDGCATVQDALIKATGFRSDIKRVLVNGVETPPVDGDLSIQIPSAPVKSISLYGTKIDADITGNVNISGVVKSISLNGTTLTTDSTGKVAITGLVKNISLNGTSYTPSSSGVLTLSNIMENNTAQTMTARLVAQNNTEYTTKQVRNIFLVPKSSSSSLPTGSSGDICIIYKDS